MSVTPALIVALAPKPRVRLDCALCDAAVLCSVDRAAPGVATIVSIDVWWPGRVHVCPPETERVAA